MIVEEVERFNDRKKKIILEDGTSFVLYSSEVRKYGIREGEDAGDGILSEIFNEVLLKRAQMRCMNLLKAVDRTEGQLRERLRRDGYPPEIAEKAIAYVASYHYTDDLRYAMNYIRLSRGKKSRRMMAYTLAQRGIDADTVRQAFEEEDAEVQGAGGNGGGESAEDSGENEDTLSDDRTAILNLLQKRHYDPDTADADARAKAAGYLLRKGFTRSDVRWALDRQQG